MIEIIYKDEVYSIIGAAMEVHRSLGCGFLEAVYQEAFELELQTRGIPIVNQQEFVICYKGHNLKKTYVVDFVAYGEIVVEIKALDQLTSREEAQVLNYLKASNLELGVLINFGAESLQWKRLIHSKK